MTKDIQQQESSLLESEPLKSLCGSPNDLLKIGNLEIECYVLENGTRVFSGRGMQAAIGFGGEASTHGSKLRTFLRQKNINPLVSNELAMALEKPLRFTRPGRGGVPAVAFEATLLIDLCDVITNANNLNILPEKYKDLVFQAQVITSAFAKAGIIAAIDEVTGYQEIREKDSIQKIINKFLNNDARKWSKTFPDRFWHKLIKVKGYPSYMALKRPAFVGHWVNDVVYDRLAPAISSKLKDLNPRTEKGHRKSKHHQHLTEDHGLPELKEHLAMVMALMDASSNDKEFKRLINRSLPKYGDTLGMDLEDD